MTATYILVSTDVSQYADQSLDEAVELAKTLQVCLTLLQVIHLTPLALGDLGASVVL